MSLTRDDIRTAIIAELARRNPGGIGRTAMMKMTYFLQEVRKVPLGYSYRLYTYGPYDGQVLDDIRTAAGTEAVAANAFQWQGGIGYEIRPGQKADEYRAKASNYLERFDGDLDWVTREFGSRTAGDLEVASTIVFIDRAAAEAGEQLSGDDLASRVKEVKPHHSEPKISSIVKNLNEMGMLTAIASNPSAQSG